MASQGLHLYDTLTWERIFPVLFPESLSTPECQQTPGTTRLWSYMGVFFTGRKTLSSQVYGKSEGHK